MELQKTIKIKRKYLNYKSINIHDYYELHQMRLAFFAASEECGQCEAA
mgnify:CR=1 FL=1